MSLFLQPCTFVPFVHSSSSKIIVGSKSILYLLWGSWRGFSVIASPNLNISGWNLEYNWGDTVRTHTRKMREIAAGVPPKGAKTCFFIFQCNAAFRPLIRHRFRPFLKQKTYLGFRTFAPVKNFSTSAQGCFPGHKTAKIRYSMVRCLWQSCSSNGKISGDGNHFGGLLWCCKILFGIIDIQSDLLPAVQLRVVNTICTKNCLTGIRATFFGEPVVNVWNAVPEEVDFSSLSILFVAQFYVPILSGFIYCLKNVPPLQLAIIFTCTVRLRQFLA